MNIKKINNYYLLFQKDTSSGSKCFIPKVLRPVCGEDGKQYDNKWAAECVGVKKKCKGACPCKGM
jgi:hypothetical protein